VQFAWLHRITILSFLTAGAGSRYRCSGRSASSLAVLRSAQNAGCGNDAAGHSSVLCKKTGCTLTAATTAIAGLVERSKGVSDQAVQPAVQGKLRAAASAAEGAKH
jgi:hypothetical protein